MYVYKAASRSVYIPPAPANKTWVYFFNESDVGEGGARVDVPTTNLEEFPLFYLRPVVPLQPTTFNVTNFYSAQRGDTVACLAGQCYDANGPGQSGAYAAIGVEGVGQLSDGQTVVNGKAYVSFHANHPCAAKTPPRKIQTLTRTLNPLHPTKTELFPEAAQPFLLYKAQ